MQQKSITIDTEWQQLQWPTPYSAAGQPAVNICDSEEISRSID